VMVSLLTDHLPVVAPTPSPARIFAVRSAATSIVSSPGVRPDHWKWTSQEPSGSQCKAEPVLASVLLLLPLYVPPPSLQAINVVASAATAEIEKMHLFMMSSGLSWESSRVQNEQTVVVDPFVAVTDLHDEPG
jgi:hypothetical protein